MDVNCVMEQQVTLGDEVDNEMQGSEGSTPKSQTETAKYASEREARCKHFIEVLMQRQQSFFDNLLPPVEQ